MATDSTTNKIAILGLITGLGLILFFFWKKIASKNLPTAIPVAPIVGQSVSKKIETGYSKDMVTFSEYEVKKYAGWIDTIVSEVEKLKTSTHKVATAQMVKNAETLKSMSDANLRAVVNYWQKVRVSKIINSPIFSVTYVDNTEAIPAFLRRLQDLGY